MPKKILFESAVHQFVAAGRRLASEHRSSDPLWSSKLRDWIRDLQFAYVRPHGMLIKWTTPSRGELLVKFDGARFYTRGDLSSARSEDSELLTVRGDDCMRLNRKFFDNQFDETLVTACFPAANTSGREILTSEADFHDGWASTVEPAEIDVVKTNEACTAPEMRWISHNLGDLRGRTLMDLGCGLGEAAVYFALKGARVTAVDISPGMCATASKLAKANSVEIETVVAPAENLHVLGDRRFDVIYAGNALHHSDIPSVMAGVSAYLKPDGIFVSWDPVAYNPIINVYRKKADLVRTKDEHPLKMHDVRLIQSYFRETQVAWFWLTTLAIFIVMALFQRRDPNKERYWKKVIEEADSWAVLYKPLELLDKLLLRLPFLRPLCWNVAIIGRGLRT